VKTWDFVVRRRKLSLEHYLEGCLTLESALEKFKNDSIIPPENDAIQEVIDQRMRSKNLTESLHAAQRQSPDFVNSTKGTKPKKRVKNPNKRRKPLKKNDGEFDEIVIINTEETSED